MVVDDAEHGIATPFIDGAHVTAMDGALYEVINPSTGKPVLSIPRGCDQDVDRAVTSARNAFADGRWSDLSPSSKKRILHCFADLIERDGDLLDALDAEEMGKPISVVLFNAKSAAELMRFHAEAVDKLTGDVFTSDKNSVVLHRRVPRGVVAAIVPWNFPTYIAVLKIAPALAAGNCVVIKPSELSPRAAVHLAQLALHAGLPPGVLNVVPGLGETVGRALGLHANVDMITFTGSTEVGKWMLQYAGRSNMKFVMAECGGKSPHVVFDDGVDLDATAQMIAGFLLTNQGQICSVGSRVLVERTIARALVEKLAAHMSTVVMGDALNRNTTFGPLASAKQCERVMNYINAARADGARLELGGSRALLESGGCFVSPTLFSGVAPSTRIAREEIFGPVLSIIPFGDEDEAVRIANDSLYGLAAYIWTADLSRGMRMAKAVRASVFINAASMGEGPGQGFSAEPFGQSGLGAEGGLPGIESYLQRQLVWISHA
jgi:acyl-CoA reductase-like NAD-dependent aldehyde dehydrogenase